MSTRLVPAVVAVVSAVLVAVLLFVPYVARQYRRRGELGIGNVGLAFSGLLYGLALLAYVLLPMPTVTPDFCATSGAGQPQLVPFTFLQDMAKEATGTGLTATLRNPALTQVLMNVALFVPLGMFVRHMFRRGVLTTTATGFGVSLLIEVTQLTGVWFLYPCAYRLFDVDDLMANTLGALAGVLAAPALRGVPGQRITAEPGAPRPVTKSRRLLAAVCDLLVFNLAGVLAGAVFTALLLAVHGAWFSTPAPDPKDLTGYQATQLAGMWLPWLAIAVGLPLAGSATSVGQRVVRLRVTTEDGRPPGVEASLVRSLTGTGGFFLLTMADEIPGWQSGLISLLSLLFGAASLIALFSSPGYRGLSCSLTGLRMTDARLPLQQPEPVSDASA